MNTLDELVYYCNETAPVGALMLTGEWGSGKTYLVEHELREKLKDTHVLVRVSLFGIDSIDALNFAVKKQWAENCGTLFSKVKDHDKAVQNGKKVASAAASVISAFVPAIKDIAGAALAINPYDYITVANNIEDGERTKKVVLIFDDLERSNLKTVDVLGCINEYCENLGFSTIIIANEEKIGRRERRGIQYDEIKEKLVARTVRYEPDYYKIINSLIEEKQWPNEDYKSFLNANIDLIDSVFETGRVVTDEDEKKSGEKKKEPPRNIRSLKCGMQDFYRIYKSLKSEDIPNIDKYLYSFLAYMLAAKAGIAKEGKYGFMFSDEDVKKVYPFFNSKTLMYSPRYWILYGIWDDGLFSKEIEYLKEESKDKLPKDILKKVRLECLDEDVIKEGFPGLIEDCYNGILSLNEYVVFIENCCLARRFKLDIPSVDWDKIIEGIKKRIDTNIKEHDDEGHTYNAIGDDTREKFSSDELRAYDIIKAYRAGDSYIFISNKKLYLDELKEHGTDAFLTCKNKRFQAFDEEMAEATAKCFDECGQSEKASFVYYFNSIWESCDTSYDVDKQETKKGFQKLIELMSELKEKYEKSEKPITASHAQAMIDDLNKLIEKLDKILNDEESKQE